jgi:electron transfer flavoprotein alpha subunit
MKCDILLVLDILEDRLVPQSLELQGFARSLGGGDAGRIVLAVPCRDGAQVGADVARRFGVDAVILEHEELYYPNPDLLGRLLRETVEELRPRIVSLLHTMGGCQTAAAVAVSTGSACITSVESCTVSDDGPVFRRSIANGKVIQSIRPLTPATVVTILPGAFSPPEERPGHTATVHRKTCAATPSPCLPLEILKEARNDGKLEDADVVIAAGRGIGRKEGLGLVEEVAAMFDNGAIAGSRPLCDHKWLPFSRQVGVTGRTVAPRLYLACGISGAQQHLAGMKGSQFIVAVNRDPDAAIFAVADCIVVEDLNIFLPLLVRKHRERFEP